MFGLPEAAAEIVCLGHPAEHRPPPVRASGSTVTGPPGRRMCFNLRVIVDGSYWVGRRAHHFDQRCS